MMDILHSAFVAAAVFSAVSVIASWISDWRFRREMERLDRDREVRDDKPTCSLCGQRLNNV